VPVESARIPFAEVIAAAELDNHPAAVLDPDPTENIADAVGDIANPLVPFIVASAEFIVPEYKLIPTEDPIDAPPPRSTAINVFVV
jgi:hypothetical protein